MKKLILIIYLFFLVSIPVYADTVNIANDTEWQALTPVRGNTYILSTGTYGSKTLNTANSGTTYIYIKSGGTVTFSGGAHLTIITDYWDIDGVTGGGPGSWTSGHGIKFTSSAGTAVSYIDGTNRTGLRLRHIAMEQVGSVNNYTSGANGFFFSTGTSPQVYDLLIEYSYVYNIGGLPFFFRYGENVIIQYCYTGHICGTAFYNVDNHCEALVEWGLQNVHFRWNFIAETPSTGGFVRNGCAPDLVQDSTDVRIYGNIFGSANYIATNENGKPIVLTSGAGIGYTSGWIVFNNTFIPMSVSESTVAKLYGPISGITWTGTNYYYNNIAYDSYGNKSDFIWLWNTQGYNWFSNIQNYSSDLVNGYAVNGSNINSGVWPMTFYGETSNPFTGNGHSLVPEDYTLSGPLVNKQPTSSTTYAGYNVCLLDACTGEKKYNIDMFGNIRTNWTIGAVEYPGSSSGGGTAGLIIPGGVTIK
jgi:hypothetical protein